MSKEDIQRSIQRTQQKLKKFEEKYNVTTDYFLSDMAAEDISERDMEYVEWAGEAYLLRGLNLELDEIIYNSESVMFKNSFNE